MLQAVIDDILRRGAADMQGLAHLIGARGVDVDELACSGGAVDAGSGHSSLVGSRCCAVPGSCASRKAP